MKRWSLLPLVLAAACAGTGSHETLRGVRLGDSVEAPGDPARVYSTRASSPAVVGEVGVDAVQRGIERASQSSDASLVGDGRLGLLAAWLAERMGDGATLPPVELTRFFALHLGLPESTLHTLLVGVPDETALESAVADSVRQYLRRQRYDAYGAAVVVRQGIRVAVVALSERPFTLDDVPRSLRAPADLPLRGRLTSGFSQPSFELRSESGDVTRLPAGGGPEFSVNLPITTEGEHEIRLLATGSTGSTVLARFPVYVGEDPPRSIRLGAEDAPSASASDAGAVEQELLRLLNAARAAQGLAALESHDGLAGVARAHSRDMVENRFIAHQSPTTGSPADRLRAADLESGLVLENLGRGPDAATIASTLLQTPQHRSNILNRDVTHVGVGVVGVGSGNSREWVVTQVFCRITRAIDVLRAPSVLLAQVNRARLARNAPEVELDPNLTNAAREASQRYLADAAVSQDDVLDDATAGLRRFAIAYRRVGGVMAVVNSLEEAATLEPTFDATVRYVGIGVAQGTRPDLPPNAIVVVYILGWER